MDGPYQRPRGQDMRRSACLGRRKVRIDAGAGIGYLALPLAARGFAFPPR